MLSLIESEYNINKQENNFKTKEKHNSEIINTDFKLELKKESKNTS